MRVMSLATAALVAGTLIADARQRSTGPPVLEAPKGTGAISGVVTDATTGRPIEGAMVSLGVTTGGSIILTLPRVMTDPKGRFLFSALAPSTKYYIRAAHVGYAPVRFGSSGPGLPSDRLSDMEIRTTDDIVTITVAADQWVSDLQIPLWRLGSISGRVVDERGEPVVGVAVRGFSTAFVAGHTQFVGTDVVATDDRGEYRLANLMPGKYAVSVLSVQSTVLDSTPETEQKHAIGELARFGGSNWGLPAVDVDGRHRLAISNFATPPPPGSGAPRAYAAQFYPGVMTMSNAQLVDIPYGSSRRGVDFQLQPVPAATVSGRLEGAGDASSMLLRLMPAGSEGLGAGSESATTLVERDGSFTFLNVPAGEYTLLAQAVFGEFTNGNGEMSLPDPPGFSGVGQALVENSLPGLSYSSHTGKAKMWGRASVIVGASDVTGVMVPMRPGITVRGRVVFSGGSGRRLSAAIGAKPANGDLSLGAISAYVLIDGETPFTLEGLGSGTYLIGLGSWFAQYDTVASVTSGGHEIRDTGLDTSAGRDVDDVVVTLTENVTSIQGAVRGDAAAGAAVIVFPVDRARWVDYGGDPILIKSKAADSNGAFLIKGLPEGEYFAVAVDRSQHDAWTNPKFLEAASAVATRIALKWGDKKTVDLQINKVVVK
jgi:uncharacterized protein (DUF2141 family)